MRRPIRMLAAALIGVVALLAGFADLACANALDTPITSVRALMTQARRRAPQPRYTGRPVLLVDSCTFIRISLSLAGPPRVGSMIRAGVGCRLSLPGC